MEELRGKISLIAPNSFIAELAEKVCKGYEDIVRIYEGNLEEGLRIAKRVLSEGCRVIISRGGTAQIIEKELEVTVVPIPITFSDLASALAKIKEKDVDVGVIGYKNLIQEIEEVDNLMGYRIYFSEIQSHEEIEERILELYKRFGVKTFLGGNKVVRAAEALGLKGILLGSGKGAIKKAILEGMRIARIIYELDKERMQLKTIAEYSNEGIILMDEQDKVKYISPAAVRLLGISYDEIIGESIFKYVKHTINIYDSIKKKMEIRAEYDQINSTKVIFNYVPLFMGHKMIGSLLSFQDVSKIEELEKKIRKEIYSKGYVAKYSFSDMLTNNRKMMGIIEMAKKIAKVDTTVLITGESGTGKELMAQSIHNESLRRNGPFIAVNCASLPQSLLESEIFGYADGAFTGAKKGGKPGLFELAHTGTIFLDEIADIPLDLQAHLLRVIQEKEISRIGDDKVIPVNIRIIAATNKDLMKYVQEGKFREDLYYRLNVINIKMPPLRERKEDIPLLVNHFISRFCAKYGLSHKRVTPGAMATFSEYTWPGNIRELQNVIERLVLTVDGELIKEDHVIEILKIEHYNQKIEQFNYIDNVGNNFLRNPDLEEGVLDKMQKEYIVKVLREVNGNKKKAAKILGISTTTLWRKIKQLNINL
ncbi:sigma 54-interacting transcriptional regulator [Thermovorax subterraneus]|nr:sigma 54-interacting transcriptional regulator [Thermovorax subterraneus]